MVVTGILIGLGVLVFTRLSSQAENTVVESNRSTVITSVQGLGAQRTQQGSFTYTGTSAGSLTTKISDLTTTDAAGNFVARDNAATSISNNVLTAHNVCVLVAAIRAQTTGISIEPYNSGVTCSTGTGTHTTTSGGDDGILEYNSSLPPKTETLYVTINNSKIGETLPGHMVRIFGKTGDDATFCAVLVRSGSQAGVGYDSWEKRKVDSDNFLVSSYEAHCTPHQAISGANCTATTPTGATLQTKAIAIPKKVDKATLAAECVTAVTAFDLSNYFSSPPKADRPTIKGS